MHVFGLNEAQNIYSMLKIKIPNVIILGWKFSNLSLQATTMMQLPDFQLRITGLNISCAPFVFIGWYIFHLQ